MDYKELIDRLRYPRETNVMGIVLCLCADAATAIETLLAEREAAMKYIPKTCYTCKHWEDGGCNAPIAGSGCDFKTRESWQWRGPRPLTASSGAARGGAERMSNKEVFETALNKWGADAQTVLGLQINPARPKIRKKRGDANGRRFPGTAAKTDRKEGRRKAYYC